MKHAAFLQRHAGWALAFGVMAACGTEDNTPPTSYGYTSDDAGSTAAINNAGSSGASSSGGSSGDMGGSTSSSSGAQGSSSSGGSSGSSGTGDSGSTGTCPSSCRANTDCAPCALPPGSTGKNCCVMGICAMMATCPTVRDSGRDGS